MQYRNKLRERDIEPLLEMMVSTGFFYESELEIVKELATENLTLGEEKSGYIFNIAEEDNKLVGFTCYGSIPGTADSFDLYWIVVHQSQQGKGLGKILLNKAIEHIRKLGGKNMWIETASRPLYEPTRMFYVKNDCKIVAELPNYYGPLDNKLIYLKVIE